MDSQSKELELANATIAKFTEQYVTGMNVNYQGDTSFFFTILCDFLTSFPENEPY